MLPPAVGHHPGHRRDDAEPVGAVHAQHVRLARRRGASPPGCTARTVASSWPSAASGASAASTSAGGRAGADQGHREVPAQPGHRRVGEVGAEAGERLGDVGDDAGPVVADDGDGELVHPRAFCPNHRARTDVGAGVTASTSHDQSRLQPPPSAGSTRTPATCRGASPGVERLGDAGQRGHAPADAGRPGAAGLRGVAGPLADAGRAGRRPAGRGDPDVGPARLPAPGAAAARVRGGARRAARRRGARRPGRSCWRCPASAPTPRGRWPPSRTASATRSWTPTCAGWSPGRWPGAPDAGPDHDRRPTSPRPRRCCRPSRRGRPGPASRSWSWARWSARPASPRCADCPFVDVCAWRRAGRPALAGPSRRPQRTPAPTARSAACCWTVLRDATGPVPRPRLDVVWPERRQRDRALAGLVDDGLVDAAGPATVYALPDAGRMDGSAARRIRDRARSRSRRLRRLSSVGFRRAEVGRHRVGHHRPACRRRGTSASTSRCPPGRPRSPPRRSGRARSSLKRICSDRVSSISRWIVRRSGRAPSTGSKPFFARYFFALSVSSRPMSLFAQLGLDPRDHDVDDLQDLGLGQLVEDDRVVDPVEELRAGSAA